MTLNASGPISLGGSTAGQSVDLEIGRTATQQISLNDFAVRQLTGTATGSTVSLPTNFWGKTGTPGVTTYFQGYYSSSAGGWASPIFYGFFTDPNGNTFLIGSQLNVKYDTWIAKIDKTGNVLWQKSYYDSAQGSPCMLDSDGCCCMDSSGNVYWISTGYTLNFRTFFINKIDNDGNMIYCRAVTMPASPSGALNPSALRINAAGTVLWATIGVQYFDTYVYTTAVVNFNPTDGSIVDQKIFPRWTIGSAPNGGSFNGAGTFIDSSNNLWMTSSVWNTVYYSTYIAAVSTSMSVVFQRVYTLPGGGYPIINAGLAPLYSPAANTIAFIGQSYDGTGSTGYARIAMQINTSTGAVSNAISFTGSNQNVYSGGSAFASPMNVDSSGNIYMLFPGSQPAFNSMQYGSLVKFNLSSFSTAWQQSYTRGPWIGNYGQTTTFDLSNSSGNAYRLGGGGGYIVYNSGTGNQDRYTIGTMFFQAPSNGDMTGTFTYSTNPAAPSPVSTTFATSSIIGTTPLTVNNTSTTQLSLTTGIFSIYPNIPITPTNTTWVVQRTLQP